MELYTNALVLRTVTEADLPEIARMWNFFQGGVSLQEARGALACMTQNHARNASGCFYHLCLAVFRKDNPGQILGWCGLDGKQQPARPDIYVLLHEDHRGKGYGTQCVKALLAHAFTRLNLPAVHGGCAKDNFASARMMEKAGMQRYSSEENGDPVFLCRACDQK